MPSQFIRDEAFSFAPISRQGRKTRWSIDAVIAEATRDPAHPEAWRHVSECRRLEPIPMTDTMLLQVRDAARAAVDSGREEDGRRFRSTGNALISRVVSYPVRVDHFGYPRAVLHDMIGRGFAGERIEDPDIDQFVRWARMSVEWSRRDLGGDVAAVAHLDEENGHCHILRPIQIDPDTGIASLGFWRPAAAQIAVRQAARGAGFRHRPADSKIAFQAALRGVAEDYHLTVGVHFGHSLVSETPRKREPYRTRKAMTEAERQAAVAVAEAAAKTESERAQKAERELRETRARAEIAEAEARSLADRLAAADAENGRLRDKLRQVLERAKKWIGALRGDAAAVREIGEPATVSEGKIDTALGVGRDDIQRRRVSAL